MRYLLLVSVLILPSFGAIPSIVTAVAADDSAVSGTSVATAATSHTAGNTLYVFAKSEGDCAAVSFTLSDTAGNTFTLIGSKVDDALAQCSRHYYAKNITGHASNIVTLTIGVAQAYKSLSVIEISGADTTSPLQTSASGATGSSGGTTATTASFSTTGNVLVLCGVAVSSYSNTVTPDTGYSLVSGSSSTYVMSTVQSQGFSTTQTNITVTATAQTTRIINIMAAAFVDTAAAPAVTRRRIIN